METKPWYKSKILWLGIIITIQGAIPIVTELLNRQVVSVADVLVALSGVGTVIIRVWFSDGKTLV